MRPYDPDLNSVLGLGANDEVALYDSVGCSKCNGTGFHGRTGVFELIEVDDELNDIVKSDSATYTELRQFLKDRGYHGLRKAGFSLVKKGYTSIEEVYRVT